MNKTDKAVTPENPERRSFVKKASYVAPAIMTLPVIPSIAQSGSGGGPTTIQDDPYLGPPGNGNTGG